MNKPVIVKAQTLTSGQTLAGTGVDLGDGWSKVYLQIPTIASGSTRVKCAPSAVDGTYYNVSPVVATANVAQIYTIDSTITNCIVEIPMAGRFAKVESTSGATNAIKTYNFICVY